MQDDSLSFTNARFNALRSELYSGLVLIIGETIMKKLKFYDIDSEYINYLKSFDDQIPDTTYDKRDKFFCGVVVQINGFDYFAPISSFKKKQRTNFVIEDKGRPVASIRFSFMIPAFPHVLQLKDFSQESQSYKDFVNAEIQFCNQNRQAITKKAEAVYKIGSNRNHPLAYTCCNFPLLEKQCAAHLSVFEDALKETAATDEEDL